MKCRVCRGPAVIDLRRHNANFCAEHFLRFAREQVARAIDEFEMLEPADRVLVAVSGGKDSLAVWDILRALGYDADGLYIGLGIGEYSEDSERYAASPPPTRPQPMITMRTRRLLDAAPYGAGGCSRRIQTCAVACSRTYCGIAPRAKRPYGRS